ncbi:hypothetical protein H6P81_019046 [Aristolochia fimbriata]|uniref:Uncharacterized protein n=1 Tax=Aristolochia fimbriata TaxID=158543 RepID=A0AAV7E5U1_ARIFI|nr:hypothetical protein H6P81_019046 [Aristolochia fimbriata]
MPQTKSPSDRRPPLAESPQQIRARRGGLCTSTSIQTPPSSAAKTQMPTRRSWVAEECRVRSELKPMLGEFQALAKMVEDELGCAGLSKPISLLSRSTVSTTLFKRGRFYDEYSARRNERLKRKKAEAESSIDHSVFNVEFGKRKTAKKTDALRKSVPANFSVPRREGLRSSVRLSKENKQPLPTNIERPALEGEKKRMATRASRRRQAEYEPTS